MPAQADKFQASTVVEVKQSDHNLRNRIVNNKPVTLNGNMKPVGLSLNDNDSLKTPTILGNSEVALKTPTLLGSPTKGPLSTIGHCEELTTPKFSLNSYSSNNQTQAFFGEHEPLLTGEKACLYLNSHIYANSHFISFINEEFPEIVIGISKMYFN